MTANHLVGLTIAELRDLLRRREIHPRDIVHSVAEARARIDPRINAYLSLDIEPALEEAERADVDLPLGGIPIAIKDAISVRGQPCTCASRILQGHRAAFDATVIERLRQAGAIPLGRTNMDEFAMGSSNENSPHGPVRNPWDPSRIPGGSSGGSAAAVASDEAVAALGSDTGGSIRQPAALCGCVGLKPSYGRVSRYGLVAFASSLDQIGPLAKTVDDAARILGAIAGPDPHDSTCLDAPVPDPLAGLGDGVRGLRIGLPREYFVPGMDPRVESAVREAIARLERLGAEIREISLPHTEHALAVYYILATAEASANLARYDGVRYGHRAAEARDLGEHYALTRAQGFGPEVKRRIILGTYVLSSGYHDAYYLRAQKARTLIRQDFTGAFETVDAIACPTSPEPAFRIGERADDPLRMYLADIFTLAANLAGICGISVPCGFAEEGDRRLPVGLQILGPALGESVILRVAAAHERDAFPERPRPPHFPG